MFAGCWWLALALACGASGQRQPPEEAAGSEAEVHPEEWREAMPAPPVDADLERRLDELLSGMTLEQKVGQLIQADIRSITPEDIRKFPLGSILNGGNSSPGNREFAPPSEWLSLADRFYAASMDRSHGGRPLPLLWGTDAVHGHNNVVGATIFPHNIGLGAARDPQLVRRIGEITAREIRATGLDWTFSPTVAVVTDLRWGRTYESYSDDPGLVREYATQFVLGLQGEPGSQAFLDSAHVLATAKHFLGDGGTAGRDQGDNRSTEAELREIHLAGYSGALAAGVQTVMVSLSSWQGSKLLANRGLLTDVLKGRLHFNGVVLGDWNGHAQVPGCSAVSCAAAVNAGLDVFMAPAGWKMLYVNTLAQVKSGEIPLRRLDDAVRRIARVKLRAHLPDEGPPSSRPLAGRFELLGAPPHRAIARQAVRESLVLLKNERHLLPLAPHQRVLVAGDAADDVGMQSGGWTLSWQGITEDRQHFPHAESIFHGIRTAVVAGGGTAELSPTGTFKVRPDVAIVVFGERPYAESHGDLATLRLPSGALAAELMRGLRSQGIPVVAVLISGRPLLMNAQLNAADAFLAAWLPGSEGGGIADVLFKSPRGDVQDFRGKLSFPWPGEDSPIPGTQAGAIPTADSPVSGGPAAPRQAAPLFALGFGLTYRDDSHLASLPERADSSSGSADRGALFVAGRIQQQLHWFVREDGESRVLRDGTGSSSTGRVQASAVDRSAQEDARRFLWNGAGPAQVGLASDGSLDLEGRASAGALAFVFRTEDASTAPITLEMACGRRCGAAVPLRSMLAASPPGEWTEVRIALACFAQAGADLRRITSPFTLTSSAGAALSVTNIQIVDQARPNPPCPQ